MCNNAAAGVPTPPPEWQCSLSPPGMLRVAALDNRPMSLGKRKSSLSLSLSLSPRVLYLHHRESWEGKEGKKEGEREGMREGE